MRISLVFALVAVTLASPRRGTVPLPGTLSGVVRDSSGDPLPDVTLQFTNGDEVLIASTRTSSKGTYTVSVDPGTIVILARRPGFAPYRSAPVTIRDEPVRHDIVLRRAAQTLGGVIVRAESNGSAFAARAAQGIPHAYFIDSTLLATKDRRSVITLFDQFSAFGVHVGHQGGRVGPGVNLLFAPAACPATVFVDGWHIDSTRIASLVRSRDIRGIEIYNAAESTPAPFRPSPIPRCAVILIWTDAGFDWEPRRW